MDSELSDRERRGVGPSRGASPPDHISPTEDHAKRFRAVRRAHSTEIAEDHAHHPDIMIRYNTAASAGIIKWLGATTPIFLMTLYIPAALVGLGGALAMPGLEIADRIFPEMLFEYAPAWLTGIILAGATAAAMSTLDSILHSNMTVLTRDVYQRYVKPSADPSHYIFAGRVIVVGLLVGLMVSIFQAATQIQEQTLAFIPKIIAVVVALVVLLPMLLTWTIEYTRDTISLIGEIWGA